MSFPNMQPPEYPATGSGLTSLAYHRAGQQGRPLIVFLPGGCHLARIAYGQGRGDRRDFLDHWFEELGCGLLGLSYPTDHPSVSSTRSDLTIAEWAAYVAEVVADKARNDKASDVLIQMWSMAGRSVFALNRACLAQGIEVHFISLAATPPLPGLIPLSDGGEPLGKTGFWTFQGNKFMRGFDEAIADQSTRAGRQTIGIDAYHEHFLCNTPIMLRGTAQRFCAGRMHWSEDEAAADTLNGDLDAAPLTATIVPTASSDMAHVLGDSSSWGHLNTQWLVRRAAAEKPLSTDVWSGLREIAARGWQRLTIHSEGGHFFFLGESGAREVAHASLHLLHEMKSTLREVDTLLAAPSPAQADEERARK
ncbi:hypothetical protein [Mesorhizobium delmotii]|nr:hypothetical protein [Mesorhizobium delmotii]